MIISVHLPKTAGSSFGSALRFHFGSTLLLDYGDTPLNTPVEIRNQMAAAAAKKHRGWDFGNVACIHGHFLPAKYQPLQDSGAVFVTWMREPLERMISHYNFWQRTYNSARSPELHRRIVEEKWSLARFAFSGQLRNVYAQFLWSFPHRSFDFIGITEHFDADLEYFSLTYLGHSLRLPVSLNAAPRGSAPQDAGPDFQRRFAEFHAEDYEIYRAAVDLRQARVLNKTLLV